VALVVGEHGEGCGVARGLAQRRRWRRSRGKAWHEEGGANNTRAVAMGELKHGPGEKRDKS